MAGASCKHTYSVGNQVRQQGLGSAVGTQIAVRFLAVGVHHCGCWFLLGINNEVWAGRCKLEGLTAIEPCGEDLGQETGLSPAVGALSTYFPEAARSSYRCVYGSGGH